MDQDLLVIKPLEKIGQKVIDRLRADGLDIALAGWIKEKESDEWYLCLACPQLYQRGFLDLYGTIQATIRQMPELGLDPLDVKIISVDDSINKALNDMPNAKPYSGLKRFTGSNLGGLSIEKGYMYSTSPAAVPA